MPLAVLTSNPANTQSGREARFGRQRFQVLTERTSVCDSLSCHHMRLTFTSRRTRLSRDITPASAPCLPVLLDTQMREQPHLSFL